MGDDVTALYRHFDADGTLLYVGIALSPIARLCQHRLESAWYEQIATVRIARYPTRAEAEAAEAAAIKAERPMHNVTHADWLRPDQRQQVRPLHAARKINRLSARGCETVTKPGYHADGGGLYLQVTRSGAKCWIFRFQINKRRREMGLGSFRVVGLAEAREKVTDMRRAVASGYDPLERKLTA